MEEEFELWELINLKYSRMLHVMMLSKKGHTLENDEIYQKLDLKIRERLSEPEITFIDPTKGMALAQELDRILRKEVNWLSDHYYILQDMLELTKQEKKFLEDLNKESNKKPR